jgi:hypothetical protein
MQPLQIVGSTFIELLMLRKKTTSPINCLDGLSLFFCGNFSLYASASEAEYVVTQFGGWFTVSLQPSVSRLALFFMVFSCVVTELKAKISFAMARIPHAVVVQGKITEHKLRTMTEYEFLHLLRHSETPKDFDPSKNLLLLSRLVTRPFDASIVSDTEIILS